MLALQGMGAGRRMEAAPSCTGAMRLASHGTAGARRRIRHHIGFRRWRGLGGGWEYGSGEHRALSYRGAYGEDAVFECYGEDGRTYLLRLSPVDLAEVQAGAKAAAKARKRAGIRAGAQSKT